MRYSKEIKDFGSWIAKETKIREIVYNKMPSSMANGISARIIFQNERNNPIKKDFKTINLVLQLSGEAENWTDIIDTLQEIQNNLLREREHDVSFGGAENPDGTGDEGGDFIIELPISITVSTGKEG